MLRDREVVALRRLLLEGSLGAPLAGGLPRVASSSQSVDRSNFPPLCFPPTITRAADAYNVRQAPSDETEYLGSGRRISAFSWA